MICFNFFLWIYFPNLKMMFLPAYFRKSSCLLWPILAILGRALKNKSKKDRHCGGHSSGWLFIHNIYQSLGSCDRHHRNLPSGLPVGVGVGAWLSWINQGLFSRFFWTVTSEEPASSSVMTEAVSEVQKLWRREGDPLPAGLQGERDRDRETPHSSWF